MAAIEATHIDDLVEGYARVADGVRYAPAVEAALEDLRNASDRAEELMPLLLSAAAAHCTPGEVAAALGRR